MTADKFRSQRAESSIVMNCQRHRRIEIDHQIIRANYLSVFFHVCESRSAGKRSHLYYHRTDAEEVGMRRFVAIVNSCQLATLETTTLPQRLNDESLDQSFVLEQLSEQKRKFIGKVRYGVIAGFVFHHEGAHLQGCNGS